MEPATAAVSVSHFTHRRGQHCGSAAYRDLLEFHSLDYGAGPLSEEMVFGLSGGMHFMYAEVPELRPPLYIGGRDNLLERDVCAHVGIDLDLRETDDPDEGWAWVEEELHAGRPTMVWADLHALDYQQVEMHHTHHDVIVVGFDLDEGVAWLADHDYDELQRCSLESLAVARNATDFPGPNRHATWVMTFPDALRDPHDAVRRALHTTVDHMRQPRGPESELYAAGLAGVDALAESFPTWPERFGEQLAWALKGVRFFVTRAGTGGALFRSLEARFLEEAADLLGDARLAGAADAYGRLADAWAQLARGLRSAEPESSHRAAVGAMREVARMEHEAVELLEGWLDVGDRRA
jgi:hypothetical protein